MRTIDKGNDINKLLERRTMMVQADLNDKLQRDVLVQLTLFRLTQLKLILESLFKRELMSWKYKLKMKMWFLKELLLKDQRVFTPKLSLLKWDPYFFIYVDCDGDDQKNKCYSKSFSLSFGKILRLIRYRHKTLNLSHSN